MKTILAHMRTLLIGLFVGGVAGLSVMFLAALVAAAAFMPGRRERHLPDPPALVERVRDVAKLETLDVSLYKKVALEPDPPPADSLVGELGNWATWKINPPAGKAIVFADAHLALDVSKIDEHSMRVDGNTISMVLPPISSTVEVRPGETEVIASNLNSKATSDLLDKAKFEIQSDVDRDPVLKDRARQSAEKSLRALFLGAGFTRVRFVDSLDVPSS